MPEHRYHLTRRSGNLKTGAIPVSTTSMDSCPPCPLHEVCYAQYGHLGGHWRHVSNGARGSSLEHFCAELQGLPPGPFRHNQAGDLPGSGGRLDAASCAQIGTAARHVDGWTYTHYRPEQWRNAAILRRLNRNLAVNLSAHSLADCDRLAPYGLPLTVVLEPDAPERFTTPGGRRGVVCPEQTGRAETCEQCMLCARQRNIIVGFRLHGPGARRQT